MSAFSGINGSRIFDRVLELSKIGKSGNSGVKRFALSEEDKEAHFLVTSWMEEAGMEVRHDNFGNLIGRKEGENPDLPVIMIGSHIDTVPNGGDFDGTIGVIGGIEVVQAFKESRIPHSYPIEVVAFCDEEGSRFADGMFGSRGMAGLVDQDDLYVKDDEGVSRYEALKLFGNSINPDEMYKSVRNNGEIKLYLEMHIEQGPYLEKNHAPVGIVKAIAGPSWSTIKITGEAGHAGTVPMNLRRDPMTGAAEIIKEIEMICYGDSTGTMVGTVGKISSFPGGKNVIPDTVEFTLDLRDINLDRRNSAIKLIEEKVKKICEKRSLKGNIQKHLEINPVPCSEDVLKTLKEISEKLNINAPIMFSGAGHDAMNMAQITHIGMIFVRCKNGISHNPNEWADKKDITRGTELLFETIKSVTNFY